MRPKRLSLVLVLMAGCGSPGSSQSPFPELHPAVGVVLTDKGPVAGGAVRFNSDRHQDFLIGSDVGRDGKFRLTTVRTTDSHGERLTGVPAGPYLVTFFPLVTDQVTGNAEPMTLPDPIEIQPGNNDLTLKLPARE